MISATCLLAWLALIVTFPVVLLLWMTESQEQRISRQRRQGWTLKTIAAHHNISISTVRRRLA
jgi:AraC-like DNA-binding protein